MARFQRSAMKSVGDYFAAFEERAGGRGVEAREPADASCGFCFAALVTALGFMISATASAAPF